MFQSFIYLSKCIFWVNTYFMSQFFLSPLVFLTSVSLLWFMSLCYEILIVVFSLFFSAVTSAFQLFTRKLCLQFSGLRMRNCTWNRFPIKNLLIDSLLTSIMESTYLNRDICKFESSQKDESKWQSTDSSKAYRNTSAFKCLMASEKFWSAKTVIVWHCLQILTLSNKCTSNISLTAKHLLPIQP